MDRDAAGDRRRLGDVGHGRGKRRGRARRPARLRSDRVVRADPSDAGQGHRRSLPHVYEVVLTNNTAVTMGVEGFEVRDARTRRVLARLSGPTLAANMGPVAGPPATTTDNPPDLKATGLSGDAASDAATTMTSSQTSVVWLDLKVSSPRPRLLEHRIVASSRPPPGQQFTFSGFVGCVQT